MAQLDEIEPKNNDFEKLFLGILDARKIVHLGTLAGFDFVAARSLIY